MVAVRSSRPFNSRGAAKACCRLILKKRYSWLVVWISLLFATMFYFNDLLFFLDEPAPWVEDPSILKWRFPVANNVTLVDDQRAIFLLSMGQEAAQSTIVERCLLSIRRVGYYLGPVILLTDVPENRYRSLTYSDPNFIVLHPPESDWQWNLRDDMPYKRFKTFTLEYLKLDDRLDHVELVYYLDIDVVVGRPLAPWFDHVESTYLHVKRDGETNGRSGELYQTKGRMIFFKGNSKRRPLQGGQFLVQRETSQPCLDRWRYYIDQHPEDPKDQSALTLILQEQNNATTPCSLSIMPQTPYLRFLDANGMQEMISTKAYPTLMHIKNTEHADWIPNRIQKRFFQQVLDLSEEEAALVGKTQIHPSDRKHQ